MSESTTPTTPEASTTSTETPASGAASPEAPKTSAPAEGTSPPAAPAGAGDSPPAVEEAPKPPPPDDKLAKGFAELGRRDKALRQREDAIKATAAEAKRYADFQAKVKGDPSALLEEAADFFGVSLDDAIEASAKKLKTETLDEKVSRLERERLEERAAAAKAIEDAKAKADEDAKSRQIDGFHADIRKIVDGAPDDFEAIRTVKLFNPTFDPGPAILGVIEEHWKATEAEAREGKREEPELWTFEEACKRVEEQLVKDIESSLGALRGSKRFSKHFAAVIQAAADAAPAAAPPPKARPSLRFDADEDDGPPKVVRTITNRIAVGAPPARTDDASLTDEEAFARIAAKFAATQKKPAA